MKKINILIVSQHFYPDSFRVNDIAKMLVAKGHKVTVITSLPDYATGRVPRECKGLKNRKFNFEGVDVIRTFSVSRRSGVIFRMLNYISFTLSSTLKATFLKEKFDIVMSYQTSPVLMANGARKFAKKNKIPFFLYCLDLWPESLKAWGVGENNPLFKVMHRYSKKIYNSADLVGITSKPFKKYLTVVNNLPKEKIKYLPQHSDQMILPEKEREDTVRFAFGGNVGSVQNLECVLKAINLLKDLDNFVFDLYGDGSELENLKRLAKELDIENKITFFGRIERETLWERYKSADAFILTLKSDSAIGLTVPAKLQEYMSGGRPIIGAIGGAAVEIINESGAGATVSAEDFEGLAVLMRDFINNPTKYQDCGKKAKEYFKENFTAEKFIFDLENIFKEMTLNEGLSN